MNILLYLIPIALTLGVLGLAAFFWASKNNQFDDLEGEAYRMLRDDEEEITPPTSAAIQKVDPSN